MVCSIQDLNSELQFEVTLSRHHEHPTHGRHKRCHVHPYKMTNIELQYETMHSDTLARSAMAEYSAGKAFLYDHVTLYKNFSFLDNVQTS